LGDFWVGVISLFDEIIHGEVYLFVFLNFAVI